MHHLALWCTWTMVGPRKWTMVWGTCKARGTRASLHPHPTGVWGGWGWGLSCCLARGPVAMASGYCCVSPCCSAVRGL